MHPESNNRPVAGWISTRLVCVWFCAHSLNMAGPCGSPCFGTNMVRPVSGLLSACGSVVSVLGRLGARSAAASMALPVASAATAAKIQIDWMFRIKRRAPCGPGSAQRGKGGVQSQVCAPEVPCITFAKPSSTL